MQITQSISGELLELTLTGSLDNDSSQHFQNAVNDRIHDGWHRILVHMDGVKYLSSAGIGAMLSARKRLAQLQGFFGICNPTEEVRQTLAQTKLLETFLCDPEQARAEVTVDGSFALKGAVAASLIDQGATNAFLATLAAALAGGLAGAGTASRSDFCSVLK